MQSFAPGEWATPSRRRSAGEALSRLSAGADTRTPSPTSLSRSTTPPTKSRTSSNHSVASDSPACLRLCGEETIYSKNNVCVHARRPNGETPTSGEVHVLGNLSVRCRGTSILGVGSSLILHWIPNVQMSGGSTNASSPSLPPSVSTFTVSQSSGRIQCVDARCGAQDLRCAGG